MTILFTILLFVSDLIETTYELGCFTRKHILPLFIATYVVGEMIWDKVTSQEWTIKVYNTPLTTGLSFA